jgi:hypothetical protein
LIRTRGRFRPLTDVVELVFLAAIVTPAMRKHVGVLTRSPSKAEPRRSSRLWRVALAASGLLTLFVMVPVEPRHTTGSIGSRITTAVVLWLLLAAAIRLTIWLAALVRRHLPRFARDHPPS